MIFTENTVYIPTVTPKKQNPPKNLTHPSFASSLVIRMDLKVCERKWLGQKARTVIDGPYKSRANGARRWCDPPGLDKV